MAKKRGERAIVVGEGGGHTSFRAICILQQLQQLQHSITPKLDHHRITSMALLQHFEA